MSVDIASKCLSVVVTNLFHLLRSSDTVCTVLLLLPSLLDEIPNTLIRVCDAKLSFCMKLLTVFDITPKCAYQRTLL